MSWQEFAARLIYHLVRLYWPVIASSIRHNIKTKTWKVAVHELKMAIETIENSEGKTDDEKNEMLLIAGAKLIGLNSRSLRP